MNVAGLGRGRLATAAFARHVRAVALTLLLLGTSAATGCVGAVVGTVIDGASDAVSYPVHEYVFGGAYKYANDATAPWRTLEDDRGRDYGHELVGVAVSGGGSRAAYFLAAALDAMRAVEVTGPDGPPRTLLDEIDYLSSVSGGSLASAYYVLKRPPTSDPVALDAFFARYRADMRRNFELRSVGRALFLFRWLPLALTYYHRGHVMASTWDADFFDRAAFADLPPPGTPYPSLIINATSYSSGQKFLFTRLPVARFNESALFGSRREGRLITYGHDRRHQPLQNAGFQTIDSDIGRFRLAMAVVASAGVPNLLGPVVLRDRASPTVEYEALGDGGIYDNYGLETLVQLFATILEERPELTARIIVVDGSGFFRSDYARYRYTVAGYADRTTAIGWLRAASYAEPFFRSRLGRRCDTDGDDPYRNLRFDVVSLYQPAEDEAPAGGASSRAHGPLAPLRGAYDTVENTVQTSVGAVVGFIETVNESAKGIGTRFKLSPADAETIEEQARLVPRVLAPPRNATGLADDRAVR